MRTLPLGQQLNVFVIARLVTVLAFLFALFVPVSASAQQPTIVSCSVGHTSQTSKLYTLNASVLGLGASDVLLSQGIVNFYLINGNEKLLLGSAAINPNNNDTATLDYYFSTGQRHIEAQFVGSQGYKTTACQTTINVPFSSSIPGNTATAISSSGTTGNYTLTGTVSAYGLEVPTGSVSFLDNSNSDALLTTATLNAATAKIIFTANQSCGSSNCSAPYNPYSVAVADFNNDGILDLAITADSGTTKIYLGNGDGTFTAGASYSPGGSTWGVVSGDFNQDGIPDLAITQYGNSSVAVYLGNGNGTFGTANIFSVASNGYPTAIATADFNNDGKLDLAVADYGSNQISILLGKGDGSFQSSTETSTCVGPYSLTALDWKQDGHADLAVVCAYTGGANLNILTGDGTGNFSVTGYTLDSAGYFITSGDFNNDGFPDLAVATESDLQIYLNNAGTAFVAQPAYTAGLTPYGAVVNDFDMDGNLDVAIININDNSMSLLYGKGDGSFTAAQTQSVQNSPQLIASADFNGDGRPDLIVSGSSSNQVQAFINSLQITATATGVNVSGATGTTHNVYASYPGDSNYNASQSSAIALNAQPGTTTITIPSTIINLTYGQTLTVSGVIAPASSTFAAADFTLLIDGSTVAANSLTYDSASGAVTATYNGLSAVTHTAQIGFIGTTVYTASTSNSETVNVAQATPTLTWSNPSDITYGTALSGTQLNATANVAGTFSYTPAAGTVLIAGPHTLSVSFTPTDSTNYSTASTSASINVNQATPSISWSAPVAIPYGTALGATQLNATANVGGKFTYSPAAGTVLVAGQQSLSVSFTPTDTTDYSNASDAVGLQVNQAGTTTTLVPSATSIAGGSSLTLTATVAPAISGTPSGSVSFYQGATLLATVALSSGTTSYTFTESSVAVLSFTAVYSGDANFLTSTSAAAPVTVQDFSFTSTGSASQTIYLGDTAHYAFEFNTLYLTTPGTVTLTYSGMPVGTKPVFTPRIFNSGTGSQMIYFSIQTNSNTAMNSTGNNLPRIALGLLFVPLLFVRRARRSARLLALLGIAVLFSSLTGCGGTYKLVPPQTYDITVTATVNGIAHNTIVQLTIE